MKCYHILVVFSLHLMMTTKAYIIIDEASDSEKGDDVESLRDGMTTFVSRPRFNSYEGGKRTVDLSDDYRELREAANKGSGKRYVILREVVSDDNDVDGDDDNDGDNDKRENKETTGNRVLFRFLDNQKKRQIPHGRTRFGSTGREAAPNSRTRFGNNMRQVDLHKHYVDSRYSGKRISPIDVYQRPRFNGGNTIDRRESKKYKVILLDS